MSVEWSPADGRPPNAAQVEERVREMAPSALVRINVTPDGWRIRALGPASLCTRGAGFEGRDLSGRIAAALAEDGYPIV